MQRLRDRISGIILVIALLALWETTARLHIVHGTTWPPFSQIIVSLVRGLVDGHLLMILLSTFRRMALGFIAGTLTGIVVGLAMGLSRVTRWTIEPLIEFFRPIPAAAIIPPLIFILGIDDGLKIFIVGVATFFPVVVNTLAGVESVEATTFQVIQTFRVPARVAVRKVILPSILPYVFAGMRTSLAIALITAVVAEMIAGSQGVGYYIVTMQYAMRPTDMYAAVIVLSVFGYGLNRLFQVWESRVLHWAYLR